MQIIEIITCDTISPSHCIYNAKRCKLKLSQCWTFHLDAISNFKHEAVWILINSGNNIQRLAGKLRGKVKQLWTLDKFSPKTSDSTGEDVENLEVSRQKIFNTIAFMVFVLFVFYIFWSSLYCVRLQSNTVSFFQNITYASYKPR